MQKLGRRGLVSRHALPFGHQDAKQVEGTRLVLLGRFPEPGDGLDGICFDTQTLEINFTQTAGCAGIAGSGRSGPELAGRVVVPRLESGDAGVAIPIRMRGNAQKQARAYEQKGEGRGRTDHSFPLSGVVWASADAEAGP